MLGEVSMKALHTLLAAAALAVPVFAQSQPARDPGFKTITQVAVVTKDIDASARRWAALLGVETPSISVTAPGNEVHMMYRGKPSNSRAKLAFLKAGQVTVELIQPLGPNTSWKKFLDEHGEGVHHIAFNVQNLERSESELKALGYEQIHTGRWERDGVKGNGDYAYFDSTKDLGLMIELLHSDGKQ
jgi:catechol 2,3-dioxygenase-like lactoylglutathione lyase family enzyme